MSEGRTLLVACGALARECLAVLDANGLRHLELRCLPASLHNRPEQIPNAVRAAIARGRADGFATILVGYGDCGTGGALDALLDAECVRRISGPHCYAFYAGDAVFAALQDAEPGTFYLTDFLARQFETLVIEGLGLDRHPELLPLYFGNYTRLVYLAQTDDSVLTAGAETAAVRLGLRFERRQTGTGGLATWLTAA